MFSQSTVLFAECRVFLCITPYGGGLWLPQLPKAMLMFCMKLCQEVWLGTKVTCVTPGYVDAAMGCAAPFEVPHGLRWRTNDQLMCKRTDTRVTLRAVNDSYNMGRMWRRRSCSAASALCSSCLALWTCLPWLTMVGSSLGTAQTSPSES